MSVFDLFRWGGNTGDGGQPRDLRWEEFSDGVKMNVLQFMDKESLTHMTEAFPSARRLVENNYGIIVVIPARNWNFVGGALSMFTPFQNMPKQISDNYIAKLVSEAEGKKIRDLEMNEMPGACRNFVFDKFITYPRHLKHVKLKYCDVQLVRDLITKCVNLESFHYQTGIYRQFPSGPLSTLITHAKFAPGSVPTFGNNFILKIDSFQNAAFQLNNLKEISLTMEYMLEQFYTDWHNVIYILLRLPVLPSVTKFNFQFSPKSALLAWKTHLLILACLADFILKIPNLAHFQYHSTFNIDPTEDQLLLNNWKMDMLSGLIIRFGSNHLKQMNATASNGPGVIAPFEDSLRHAMNLAAGSLRRLQSLDLKLGEAKEHRVFRDFIFHLPSAVRNVLITDLSLVTHEPEIGRANVYKVFALPHRNPQRPTMFDSMTILTIHCTKALIQRASLTRVLEGLPQLIELEFKGPSETPACFLDFEDRPANPEIFSRLQKLSIENICVAFEVPQAQDPRQSSVLCRFTNLKELRLVTSFVTRGVLVVDVLEIVASLRQLNKVHVKPMLWASQLGIAGQLHPIGMGLELLGRIGRVNQCGPDMIDINGHIVHVYDFVLDEFELLTI